MTTTSEISAIETLKKRKRYCFDLQGIAKKATGVHSNVVLMTFYTSKLENTSEVGYCDNPLDGLTAEKAIYAIDNTPGKKIVSDSYKGDIDKIMSIPEKNALSFYFTESNRNDSEVVPHEEALLKACGYKIDKGYFFAIPFPPGMKNPKGVFFLFARDDQEASVIGDKIASLQKAIQGYFI